MAIVIVFSRTYSIGIQFLNENRIKVLIIEYGENNCQLYSLLFCTGYYMEMIQAWRYKVYIYVYRNILYFSPFYKERCVSWYLSGWNLIKISKIYFLWRCVGKTEKVIMSFMKITKNCCILGSKRNAWLNYKKSVVLASKHNAWLNYKNVLYWLPNATRGWITKKCCIGFQTGGGGGLKYKKCHMWLWLFVDNEFFHGFLLYVIHGISTILYK